MEKIKQLDMVQKETGVEGTQVMTPEDDHIVDLDGDTEGVEGSFGIDDILPSSMGSQKKTNQPHVIY